MSDTHPRDAAAEFLRSSRRIDFLRKLADHSVSQVHLVCATAAADGSTVSLGPIQQRPANEDEYEVDHWERLLGCMRVIEYLHERWRQLPQLVGAECNGEEFLEALLDLISENMRRRQPDRPKLSFMGNVWPTGHRAAWSALESIFVAWTRVAVNDASDEDRRARGAGLYAHLYSTLAVDGLSLVRTYIDDERAESQLRLEASDAATAAMTAVADHAVHRPDQQQRAVLLYLSRAATPQSQQSILASQTVKRVFSSRATLSKIAREMLRLRLVEHPQGKKKLLKITPSGIAALQLGRRNSGAD